MPTPDEPRLCAFCRRHPVEPGWRPFCSERCKVQDLARWVSGAYQVPGETLLEPLEPDEKEKTEDF